MAKHVLTKVNNVYRILTLTDYLTAHPIDAKHKSRFKYFEAAFMPSGRLS
jgi:hypothetical protein